MFYGNANAPATSTQAEVTNPSTTDILAEVVSAASSAGGRSKNYEARVIVGASTFASFIVEQVTSTAIGSNTREGSGYLGRHIHYVNGQSAQFMVRFHGEAGDRIRVRVKSGITGEVAAMLQVEPLV